jgi:hypothetical protein
MHKFELITQLEAHSIVHSGQILNNIKQHTSLLENKIPNAALKMYLGAPTISDSWIPSAE